MTDLLVRLVQDALLPNMTPAAAAHLLELGLGFAYLHWERWRRPAAVAVWDTWTRPPRTTPPTSDETTETRP